MNSEEKLRNNYYNPTSNDVDTKAEINYNKNYDLHSIAMKDNISNDNINSQVSNLEELNYEQKTKNNVENA